jgi:hypothetical protein
MINSQGLRKGKGMLRGQAGADQSRIWDDANSLAINALAFLAADVERLGRFLGATGLGPDNLRSAAQQPGFLAGVLSFIMEDEALTLAFAANAGVEPGRVAAARRTLDASPADAEAL